VAALSRLIVTLAADMASYSSLVAAEAEGAPARLEAHRHHFVYPKIAEHRGRVAKATGDRLLVEFASPIEAVQCAVETQRGMIDRNASTAPARRIMFRVGINIGEATADGDDLVSRAVAALPIEKLATLIKPGTEIYGDGGNMAVRLAALTDPGGICISGAVRDAIADRLPHRFEDIGEHNLDISTAPVRCYAMSADCVASIPPVALQKRRDAASRRRGLRSAAVAASLFAVVGIWSAGLWAWLGADSSTTPMTVSSHISAVSTTMVNDEKPPSAPQPSVKSNTEADREIPAPPAPQPSVVSNTEADRSPQVPPARSSLAELGAAVIRGKEAPSALQTTPDTGIAVIRGHQEPSVPPTAPDRSATIVRGKQRPPP
jgi:adenylate cyclase